MTASHLPVRQCQGATFPELQGAERVNAHGVGRRGGTHDKVSGHSKPVANFYLKNALYAANQSLDRDHGGIACEKH